MAFFDRLRGFFGRLRPSRDAALGPELARISSARPVGTIRVLPDGTTLVPPGLYAEPGASSQALLQSSPFYPTIYSPDTPTGRSPILRMARELPGHGREHDLQMALLHAMRQLIPALNGAITSRRMMEGVFRVRSDNKALERELEGFVEMIPVGLIDGAGRGLNLWADAVASAADEYGLGLGQLERDGREIERLTVIDMRTVFVREITPTDRERQLGRVRYQILQRTKAGFILIDTPALERIVFRADGSERWPIPMAWGLQMVAEIMVRLLTALSNLWLASGEPSMLNFITYEIPKQGQAKITQSKRRVTLSDGTQKEVDAVLADVYEQGEAVFRSKNLGRVANAYVAATGAKLEQYPLFGDISKSLAIFLDEHYPIIEGQIIQAAQTPAWMFPSGAVAREGLVSNQPSVELDLYLAAAQERRKKKAAIARNVIDAYLVSTGRAFSLGNYRLVFEDVSR